MQMQLKNAWLFSKSRFIKTIFGVLLTATLSGLFVLMIVKVFCANDPEITYIHFMSLISYIVLWMMIFLTGMTDFGKTFDMMVGMGRTRKEFYLSYGLVNFGTYLVYGALVLAIAWLETVMEKVFYGGIPCELNLSSFFFDVRTIVLTVVGGFCFNMVIGALYLKFRQKIFMLVWLLFMFMGVIMQMIGKAIDARNPWMIKSVDFIVRIFTSPAVILIPVVILIVVLLVSLSYLLVRKREIAVW